MASYIDLTDDDQEFGVEIQAEIQAIDLVAAEDWKEELKKRIREIIERQFRWDVEAYNHQLRRIDLLFDRLLERQQKDVPLTRPH
jgi:hypothetical protein